MRQSGLCRTTRCGQHTAFAVYTNEQLLDPAGENQIPDHCSLPGVAQNPAALC